MEKDELNQILQRVVATIEKVAAQVEAHDARLQNLEEGMVAYKEVLVQLAQAASANEVGIQRVLGAVRDIMGPRRGGTPPGSTLN